MRIILATVFGLILAGYQGVLAENLAAPHGGVIRESQGLYLELVLEKSTIKMYPLTRDLRPVPMEELAISVSYTLPKVRPKKVKFKKVADHFEGSIAAGDAKTYSLEIFTKYKGKSERSTFRVNAPR